MTHRAGVGHIHEALHAEGKEAAAQDAPAVSEAVCVHLSRVPVLACTLLTLEQGPHAVLHPCHTSGWVSVLWGVVLQSWAESCTEP